MITGDFVNGLHLMVGLSTDTKPETTSENTFFMEEDTGDVYYFSAGAWAEAGADVAGIVAALLNKGALPAVTAADNGKVLGVDDGVWTPVEGGADPEAIAQAVADWLDENITEPTEPVVDASLSVDGAAADALVTGKIFTDEAKNALLACFEQVAWKTPYGQTYLSALETALFPVDPPASLSYITAAYEQDRPVYDTDSLDVVALDLVVTAHYSDGTTETLTDNEYTLSGTLTEGTSTITATYEGKTATFDVSVTGYVPSIYQKVEWIGSSGTQKIDTGYEPAYSDLFDMEMTVDLLFPSTTTAKSAMCAGFSAWGGQWFGLLTSGKLGLGNGIEFANATPTNKNRVTMTWGTESTTDYGYASCGAETINRLTTDDRPMRFCLFINHTSASYPNTFPSSCRIYYAKLEKNTQIIMDLYPVYRKSDGVIGFFDAIGRTFLTNAGTGTFTKGADV